MLKLLQDFVRASTCIGSVPFYVTLKEPAAAVRPVGFGSFAGSPQSMKIRTNI